MVEPKTLVFCLGEVFFGGNGSAGDSSDAGWGAEPVDAGADGKLWVVKFKNNPQHLRVLANELIATRLAAAVGLTVPVSDVVEVSEWLIANSRICMLSWRVVVESFIRRFAVWKPVCRWIDAGGR